MITANCNWFNCLECFLKLKPKRLTSENVVVVLWSYSHVLVYALILLNKLHLLLQMVILLPKAPLLLLQSLLFIVTRKCGPLRFSLTLIDFFQRTAKDAIHSPSFLSQLDQETVLVGRFVQSYSFEITTPSLGTYLIFHEKTLSYLQLKFVLFFPSCLLLVYLLFLPRLFAFRFV